MQKSKIENPSLRVENSSINLTEVLRDFFAMQSAQDCNKEIWSVWLAAQESTTAELWSNLERGNFMHLLMQLTELIKDLEQYHHSTNQKAA